VRSVRLRSSDLVRPALAALAVSDKPDDGDDLRTALLVIDLDLLVHGCRSYRAEAQRSPLGGDQELAGFPCE
jgi:hypothetical protein